jgi:hypothetical protein
MSKPKVEPPETAKSKALAAACDMHFLHGCGAARVLLQRTINAYLLF